MEPLAPTMQNLFAQLGEPHDTESIARFMQKHGHMQGHTRLHEAPFWSPAQSDFLREALVQDAGWAPVVDALNVSLHEVTNPA